MTYMVPAEDGPLKNQKWQICRKMSEGKKNELAVITMTKELAKYVLTVTQKSPKHFRFSLVAKLQSLSIEAVEYMYRANDFFVSKDRRDEYDKRLSCQRQARG